VKCVINSFTAVRVPIQSALFEEKCESSAIDFIKTGGS